MGNKRFNKYPNGLIRKAPVGKRIRRARAKKYLKERQARLQLDQLQLQQEAATEGNGNGPKLNNNQDQSIDNLVGYNFGCCPITSRFFKAILCPKCLLWFHVKCIYLSIKDREDLRNNQWVCYNCKEPVIVVQNQNDMKKRKVHDEDQVDKKFSEVQNKEKAIALKTIDGLKLKNNAIEKKIEEISKWVKNKFGVDIPEEIAKEAEMEFEYIKLLKEQYQILSKVPVIELNRISGIKDKRLGGTGTGTEGSADDKFPKKIRRPKMQDRFCPYENCPRFLREFKYKSILTTHIERHVMAGDSEKERRFPGDPFIKKFRRQMKAKEGKVHYSSSKSKYALKRSKNFICPRENCEKKFTLNCRLQNHIKYSHDKIKRQNVICHYCGKLLSSANHIRKHIERFHELYDRKFECPEDNCSKRFAHIKDLEKHITTHYEPAEYIKCTEEGCLKRFKNKNGLKYHLEIHAAKGVKNLACPLCDKTFATRNCLSAHKRMSHAKEVNHAFKCTFEGCNLGYSIRKYLEDHLKTHDPNYQPLTKQKLIICQYCAKEYETFFQLNRHIQKVHEK